MLGPEFRISCEQDVESSRYVVTIVGDIDMATVPAVREFILALAGEVDVNCEAVSFIDSAGIGMFLGLHHRFNASGRRIALKKLTGNCYRLFEITGLTDFLDVQRADSA